MEIIDCQFLETPWYGSRQMVRHLAREGHKCGRHRVRRLMQLMRLVPIYQEPKTSKWSSPTEVVLRYVQENGGNRWQTSDQSQKRLLRSYGRLRF
ncbi:IS3 family transposase [Palleronia caenipelagi]